MQEGQGYSTSFNPAMAQHMQEENSKGMPMEEVNSSRLLAAGSLRSTAVEDCNGIRSLSFSRLFSSFRVARASSLDIDELASAPAADADADSCAEKESKQQQLKKQVCRTQSLPMNSIRSIPQHKKRVSDSSSLLSLNNSNSGGAVFLVSAESAAAVEEEEEVAEEEAVCRICMVALSGEGEGMKLECRCKGELALAHRACAVKWFSIKGNATCEVCSHNVLNLPVTLRRIPFPNPPPPPPSAEADTPQNGSMLLRRVWHGTPVLVVVSMLAYFCFLEQLLVGDHGTAALAISLPFAFVLGLFSSLTTTKMVSRRYIWIYSAVQFLFIVLFTHLFYRYVRIQAVIAIILSTFSGFSVAISINALLIQIIRWRASLASPSASDLEIAQP